MQPPAVVAGLVRKMFSQHLQYPFELAFSNPPLESTMAGLVRGILIWQFAPLCP